MKNYLLLSLLVIVFASCSTAKKGIATAQINYTDNPSKKMGTANFYDAKNGEMKMVLKLQVKERANNNVAVHFHEHGDCGNKGDNTHGHWNPTNEKHGQWGGFAFHSGDIGNIKLNKKGKASVTITTSRWSVDERNHNYIIGRGIIVHGGTDDYTTQPTGNSGPRIGCGVIVKN